MACAKKCATKGGKTAKVAEKKPAAGAAKKTATKAAAKGGKTCKGSCKK